MAEADQHVLHDPIIAAIRTIRDPEIPVNIHDLGLIYGLEITDDGDVTVEMTLTTPNCPMAEKILQDVRTRVAAVEGVAGCDVSLVWEPVWTSDRMSEAAKLELEFTGHVPGPSMPGQTSLTIGKSGRRSPRDRR